MGLFSFLNPFAREKPNPVVYPPSKPPVPADARRELLALQAKVGLLEQKLKSAEARFHQSVKDGDDQRCRHEMQLDELMTERQRLMSKLDEAQKELAILGKFASVKSDSRKVVYGVSQELRKRWLSIEESVDRHQVVDLLGQPSLIMISENYQLRQVMQSGHAAGGSSAEKLGAQVTDTLRRLLFDDQKLARCGERRVISVWVYADDTMEPGFIFFASEADGGGMLRCFPPEC
jgi:hypothetical protein